MVPTQPTTMVIREQSYCVRRHVRTSITQSAGAYEGDGQTTVSVINQEYQEGLLINTVNQYGFRLNNNSQIIGPLAIFNKVIFSWNVQSDLDISLDSLCLFAHLEPKLDVLLIGLSDYKQNAASLIPVITGMKKFCNVEMLPTERACATFNFLSSEGRVVGAALIPPVKISFTDNDVWATKDRTRDLYKVDWKNEII
uniref:NADH dehydrogenase [ubiquinone] 1 alpha subcomplex assembly factor 3 n=2 Tax=Cacopsylla melanoneura TaxID=428564 RepID=A0A8D9BYJ2_9HEMI